MIDTQNLVSDVYKTLSAFNIKNDVEAKRYIITGDLSFKETYKGFEVKDSFNIKVFWPYNVPKSLPKIFECGKRIPHEADFHVNPNDNNSLCLATRRVETEILSSNPTFENYIISLVIPFFYAFVFKTKNNYYPWGEEKHAEMGVLEDFMNYFHLPDIQKTKNFLFHLVLHKKMKGHHLCPCGSGKKFRDCHAPLYWKLNKYYTQRNLLLDCISILPSDARENHRLKSLYKKCFHK